MSIYAGTTKSRIKQTAIEARAEIQHVLSILDTAPIEHLSAAVDAVHEAAGLVGNLEGEVEAYVEEHS